MAVAEPCRQHGFSPAGSCQWRANTAVWRRACFRGCPPAVRIDNGPGFTSRAFMARTQQHGVEHLLIEPGRPMQNGYVEGCGGKFRDECLNERWSASLAQARDVIANQRRDDIEVRPHSSCGCVAPARFAANHRA